MEAILDFIINSPLAAPLGTALGFLAAWFVDNRLNKPEVVRIARAVAAKVEDYTEEGTAIDNFLDAFIGEFESEKGREPSAGELKTALKVKKDEFGVALNKDF